MGDSLEKLRVVKSMIEGLPGSENKRLKSISLTWKMLESEETGDSAWLPCFHVEYYDGKRPREVEVEITEGIQDKPQTMDFEEGKPSWEDGV